MLEVSQELACIPFLSFSSNLLLQLGSRSQSTLSTNHHTLPFTQPLQTDNAEEAINASAAYPDFASRQTISAFAKFTFLL
jgi:hypothetical protein